jgi:hypothetical protein
MFTMKLGSLFSVMFGVGLTAAGAGSACSATRGQTGQSHGVDGAGASGTGANGSASGGAGAASSTGGINLAGTGAGSGTSNGGASSGFGGACAAQPYEAKLLPLDMYIMQDQSASMSDMVSEGGTKWQAVTKALTTFAQQPGLTGISMGLQYFGLPPSGNLMCSLGCTTDADCGACAPCSVALGICLNAGSTDSCIVADYAMPEVEIAPLPGVATAIVSSLAMHMPSTATPTGPALQGAVNHAKAWATAHPGHVTIAVLATDGEPNECNPQDQAGLAQIAATALAGTPSIKTFTIGTFAAADIPSGPNLLDAIASAGGTGQAFNIDTTQNVNQAFLDALNKIRGSALGCKYTIPMPTTGMPDFSKINVQYTPGGGKPVNLLQYPDATHCPASGDGWYYDNNSMPTQIELCPSTCTTVTSDTNGTINILLGCQTKKAT